MTKLIVSNKKAWYDFDIIKEYEAGIVLQGWEVKSIQAGKISLIGAYIKPVNNELFLVQSRVNPVHFVQASGIMKEDRERKLLLQKSQIMQLIQSQKAERATIVPLEVYMDKRRIKILIGLAKGKRKFEKKDKMKQRDLKRQIDQERKQYNI